MDLSASLVMRVFQETLQITAAMTSEQLNQIAETVRNKLLNRLDTEVAEAMHQLGITDEISDDEW
jgi:chromosome condensin MukBEF complex kleisin-like MukF subunit